MPSFFAESDWFECKASDRPCTSGSASQRRLQFVDFDEVLMPGFLTVLLDGSFAGYGYSVTEGADPSRYTLIFFETLGIGVTVRYASMRVLPLPTPGHFQIEGKFRIVRLLNGAPEAFPKGLDPDDWTANRPTA